MRCKSFQRVIGYWAILVWLANIATSQGAAPVHFENGDRKNEESARGLSIVGPDAGLQLLVAETVTGRPRDVTREARFESTPAGIIAIDESGWITPRAEGVVQVTAHTAHGSESIQIAVTGLDPEPRIRFSDQVVPILTKYGCNSGGCHGKSGGQNGFRLSLFGFQPDDDYRYLVDGTRGRRVFPAAAERSLLLQKASGTVPHGGGARIAVDSAPYRILKKWIAQDLPPSQVDDPHIVEIRVTPKERELAPNQSQQLAVSAYYSDGSVVDVTRVAHFESNDTELAEVNERGLVVIGKQTGRAAILARFQTHLDLFYATVPLGKEIETTFPHTNPIDSLAFANLKQLGLPPSLACDDATFLRRATIDLAGRLPTLAELESFRHDGSADKRIQLIDRLLDSPDYADYFANKWSAILRNRRGSTDERKGLTYAFHQWIRASLLENKPYDQFVRELLTASGHVHDAPAVAWYHEVRGMEAQTEDMAQLFLGLRIQCARCHHHPQEKWSQHDYYGLAAFFSRLGEKPSADRRGLMHIVHQVGKATVRHPVSGLEISPTPLGGAAVSLPDDRDPRHALVDWMTAPDNRFFARALVNRYWKHFFGFGLVHPEDDMRVSNPPSNPQLLDGLAEYFIQQRYDLKALIRLICTSHVYGLTSEPNPDNRMDQKNLSRFAPRRLPAEVLLDAINQVTETTTTFAGVPSGYRAVQLPDMAFPSDFLSMFGRPEASSACECERSSDVNLAQTLQLVNSTQLQEKLGQGRAARLHQQTVPHDQRVRELYAVALSRDPTAAETAAAVTYLNENASRGKEAYEDLVWALVNTKEFLFNH